MWSVSVWEETRGDRVRRVLTALEALTARCLALTTTSATIPTDPSGACACGENERLDECAFAVQ